MHLVLVDGSGFIFRAFHALPPMTRPDGTPVNAVFGFTNMLARLLKDHVGTHLAVIFDAGRTTFRNRIYDAYKAHRPDPPAELIPQFALVRDATVAFGVPAIELADWEADDLIAAYAKAAVDAGGQVTIVSSDKDLMQLIRPGVLLQDPIKQKTIGPDEVREKFGCGPEHMIDLLALMGDSVDNVPGVPGIGPKTACQLLAEFGDLEGVLAGAHTMKPSKRRELLITHAEQARLSRQLVILRDDVPLPEALDTLVTREPERAALSAWLHSMGFRSTATRLGLDGPVGEDMPPPPPQETVLPFGPYGAVDDAEGLAAVLDQARAGGVVAIFPVLSAGELVGLGLATAPGRACYLPLAHEGDLERPVRQLNLNEARIALDPVLADPALLKVFHDAKAGLLALSRAGFGPVLAVDDDMLLSYAQDAGAHAHTLEDLSRLHLGHTVTGLDAVTGTGRTRLALSAVATDRAASHVAEAADCALRLRHALRARLADAKATALYEQLERRLIPVLGDMERAGITVDEAELRRLSADFGERMAVGETEIHKLAGRPFNLGSPKVLGEILFDEMKLPGGRRTSSGTWGTDAAVLQTLAEGGAELPGRILEWRQLAKLKSTYADALVTEIDRTTGRVHTTYTMAATTTGRLSSNDPNLQNIPIRTEEGGRIRRAFVAAPGHQLVSADYSQIELRLLAHVADVPALSEAFATGQDIHSRTASEVFGVPMAQMTGLVRRRAKAINFGIIYGISAFGLARQLQIEPGEAKAYIDAYFARYPGIRAYMESTREEARIHGFVLTPFGRRCWVPGIADRNGAKRAYAERQASNAPLQGGAADIIKRAMVRLPAAIAGAGLTGRMLLQVHDELLFEAPDAEVEAFATLVKRVMENAAVLSVPLVVETGTGGSWAAAH
ncbi:DNA polymerase I [Acidisphaera sp. L21]|uniref:DNA polymerase I n=1 Tax=Acidisphaera sp. L21 TaxID=1641851 RepID=UPI00131D63CA|nr:DNA polymerase I [Acidisphaera sp. L21]